MLKKFLPISKPTHPKEQKSSPGSEDLEEEVVGDKEEKKASRPVSFRKRMSIAKAGKSQKEREDQIQDAESQEQEVPEVEIIEMTESEKKVLRESWKIVYKELGCSLCYVGSNTGVESSKADMNSSAAVDEAFIRLFEEYPSSQEFFIQFRGSPIEDIKNDAKMLSALKEHAVRVFQIVEKVIGRLDDLRKVRGDKTFIMADKV